MRNVERVTLVICTNANDTHKIPVAMTGQANNPMCFRGEGKACPLPYVTEKRAWMDKDVYKRWWKTVFLPAVRERHKGSKCDLIMDNASTHNINLSAEDVDIFLLPPNSTAVYQHMDAGFIASLKRSYKRRLLAIFVRSLPVPLVPPSPTPPTGLPPYSTIAAATGNPSDAATPRAHDPPHGPAWLL